MTLEDILAEVFSISATSIKDDMSLKDIPSWDSMTHIVLITHLEEHYDFRMTGDEIADLKGVGDIRKILQNYNKI